MLRNSFLIALILFSSLIFFQAAEARTIRVSGSGSDSSYCNANSGNFCLDSVKRRAEQDATYDATRVCEFQYRGRALRYTASHSTFCNPSYLPPNHDGTFVRCSSNASMQCEVQ